MTRATRPPMRPTREAFGGGSSLWTGDVAGESGSY